VAPGVEKGPQMNGGLGQRIGRRDADDIKAGRAALGDKRRLDRGGRSLTLPRVLRWDIGLQKSRSA
jgi:hypothetical protein